LNPFNSSQENVLGLSSSFRNSLFYNRGKQHIQSLTYLKKWNKICFQDHKTHKTVHTKFNILIYTRKVGCLALCKTIQTDIASENFIEKNYTIKGYQIAQNQLSLFKKHQLGCFFTSCKTKKTRLVILSLVQNRFEPFHTLARNKSPWMVKFLFIRINLMEWIFCCWFSNARRSSNRAEYNLEITLAKKKNNTVLDVIFYQGRKSESQPFIPEIYN
jgi:hypothetical protein